MRNNSIGSTLLRPAGVIAIVPMEEFILQLLRRINIRGLRTFSFLFFIYLLFFLVFIFSE